MSRKSVLFIKDAIVLRFKQLCAERNLTSNDFAVRAGITPSTVYSMMDSSRRDISIVTVKKLCDGLDISITAFFNDPLFETLDQEIK